MAVTATLSPTEAIERRLEAARLRRVEELREIWTQDLKMLVRTASDSIKKRGPLDAEHLEEMFVVIGDEQPDGYEAYVTCIINKAGTLHLVPDLYELVGQDSHDHLVIVTLASLVHRLVTNETLDAVEEEGECEIVALRAALEQFDVPDNI